MPERRRETGTTAVVGTSTPPAVAANRSTKESAATVSLVVVFFLGLIKLVVGILSGSLGVVADAIHSGLDFVAALLTVLAVRWADRPADADHPYGHGRAENVAAFVEIVLLIITAGWIGDEAVHRILEGGADVQPGPLAFVVMLVSMGASLWRSRHMRAVAREHNSPALNAGALNFAMDVWSSLIVLVGLAIVAAARALALPPAFDLADSFAGLAVAGFVVLSAVRLARETIDALVDKSPEDLALRFADVVAKVPGVIECRRVRVRRVGGGYFADVVAVAARGATLEESRRIVEQIEAAVRGIEPNTDVVVALRPGVPSGETVVDRVNLIARELGVHVHDVSVQRVDGKLRVNLHVEVDPALSIERAHALVTQLEERIQAAEPRVSRVNTHVETEPPGVARRIEVTSRHAGLVKGIEATADEIIGPARCHEVQVYQGTGPGAELDVVLHCSFPPTTAITTAHLGAERLERALRERFPRLSGILVHVEPIEPDTEK